MILRAIPARGQGGNKAREKRGFLFIYLRSRENPQILPGEKTLNPNLPRQADCLKTLHKPEARPDERDHFIGNHSDRGFVGSPCGDTASVLFQGVVLKEYRRCIRLISEAQGHVLKGGPTASLSTITRRRMLTGGYG